jgi:hypothetical protein
MRESEPKSVIPVNMKAFAQSALENNASIR